MPKIEKIKKVLVIGSGPIVIGQAAEFDYAGSQACKVLKSEGVSVVLVNSNPATIMTDKALADSIYLEPLTLETIKRVIELEKPDGILASLGGQTGLTLAMQLHKEGYLEKRGISLLGTDADAIIKAEDRAEFKATMEKLHQPCIASEIAETTDDALKIAEKIGYPVIVRPAFTLGGFGGGVAQSKEELKEVAENGLKQSPITQILVEKYIYGYKEIEFEVMRDGHGNVISVCSMENFDPVGVHTGDSIVVAPALTLSDKEYQMLRSAALSIISELKIEGGCNCQFALNPDSMEYFVIEVNPRVSRSSALASKATGYPIAKVSAKIALGYNLDEIKNEVTGETFACFEPALDYVVVKMPKFPFDKFRSASRKLGTQMKATGEVMAIAPSFEQALLKAVRGAEISMTTLNSTRFLDGDLAKWIETPSDARLFAVFAALKRGLYSVEELNEITKIDKFFLYKLQGLCAFEKEITGKPLSMESYEKGKKLGYLDRDLARISGSPLPEEKRAVFKMVDTCAAEFAAKTPYFYATYDGENEQAEYKDESKRTVLVLGSGPIRIGQGIEFDYSSVHSVWALKRLGYDVAIVNNNPETVSTDFDVADRLYFEPLDIEDVMNVIAVEKPIGVVVAFGGQTAIKLVGELDKRGLKLLGTSAEGIDKAEDREKFDALLSECGILRPRGAGVETKEEALNAARELGYPVLVRPSYVIGGENMTIAFSEKEVADYMDRILSGSRHGAVLVDKYLMGIELEVDAISDGDEVLIPGIMEHIERAGVHSGDSIAVYPPYNIDDIMKERIVECSTKLAKALGTRGLVNVQYVIYLGELYVIEVNPRASRTIPYISKVTGIPMVDIAADVMMGKKLKELGYGAGLYKTPPYVAVKVPVFSFEKLGDANSILSPEMKSTGEVLGIGKTLAEGMFKGLTAAGFNLKKSADSVGVFISVHDKDKLDAVALAKKFEDLGATLYATENTARTLMSLGNEVNVVRHSENEKNVFDLIDSGKVDYIVNTCSDEQSAVLHHIALRRHALQKNIACMTSLDTANALADILAARFSESNTELVNLNNMRSERLAVKFSKMQSLGNDYIYVDNRDGKITCPESLAISFSDRHFGIGADGLVLIENSTCADAKMRMFNKDGSEGMLAGNCLRCVAKFLYDNGIAVSQTLSVETASGIKTMKLYLTDGFVSSVTVDMGKVSFLPKDVPTTIAGDRVLDKKQKIAGSEWNISLCSVGNPHAVVFCDSVDAVNVEKCGREFEFSPLFPERINTEFVRVINRSSIKMRVWERGNGETLACGTGAVAAVAVATELGLVDKNVPITVRLRGGDLVVSYDKQSAKLTGNAVEVYDGYIRI